jgi:L-alanine-DL-glutamate epimerase-like enolase superfamily enzyme
MLLRDICIAAGLPMRIEDTAGTEFIRAATGHLALSTPPRCLISGYPFENTRPPTADGGPEIRDGHLYLSDQPGLGLTPDYGALGKPLLEFT